MQHSLNAYDYSLMFTGNPLNRMDNERRSDSLWQQWQDHPGARTLLICGDKTVITEDYRVRWFSGQEQTQELSNHPIQDLILLGLDSDDIPHFAARLENPPETFKLKDLRTLAFKAEKANADMALLGQAKSMLDWHKSHQYCSHCGHQSQLVKMGYERKCPNCGASHFPRTDPVVIMLGVHKESDCALLGRPHRMPEGIYTALAGFMEPGESVEECCAREMHEEAGVTVTRVTYIASQPWPYPSSLMIGCIAEISDKDLVIDTEELDDARWFTRQQVTDMLNSDGEGLTVPPPLAIAHHLVAHWIKHV